MFRHFSYSIVHEPSCCSIYEVVDDKLVLSDLSRKLPSSCEYSLSDLLAAGVKVSPVDPTIVHDSSTTLSVANDFINNISLNSNSDESKI